MDGTRGGSGAAGRLAMASAGEGLRRVPDAGALTPSWDPRSPAIGPTPLRIRAARTSASTPLPSNTARHAAETVLRARRRTERISRAARRERNRLCRDAEPTFPANYCDPQQNGFAALPNQEPSR